MPEIITKSPKQLKVWRKKNKLSQMKLAEIMGYSRKSYMQIAKHESGTQEIKSTHAWQNLMRWCEINKVEY